MPIAWLPGGIAVLDDIDLSVMDVEAPGYADQASQLLPHGPAWSRRPESVLQKLVSAGARTYARLHTANERLHREIFPDTADELLELWERTAGIEEPAVGLEDRRKELVTKLYRSRGPLTREVAAQMARSLGYSSITWLPLYRPLLSGSICGQALAGPGSVGWQWHTLVRLTPKIPEFDARITLLYETRVHSHMTIHVLIEG